jgi:hypothetical protein
MRLPRRQFLHLAAGAAALPVVSRSARAQTYPSRPVRIVVGFTAGGPGDILARLIGQWPSERLGKPLFIENRPGAAGNIGTEVVVRSPPDGHTLLLISSANFINATLYEKLNFNFIRDIAPVASIIHLPNVMDINPSVPVKTVPEFIAYARYDAANASSDQRPPLGRPRLTRKRHCHSVRSPSCQGMVSKLSGNGSELWSSTGQSITLSTPLCATHSRWRRPKAPNSAVYSQRSVL